MPRQSATKEEARAKASAEYAEARASLRPGRRVAATVLKSPRSVFSLKLGDDELDEIAEAAEASGQSVGAFIRDAALERARGRNRGGTRLRIVREKARELTEAVNRL
jgi:uncharacterized protein (DUF1778 family)